VDCAAFEAAGVRAYPEVEVGDVVRLTGEVELRRDELQVETAALEVLEGDDRDDVAERLESALVERARPPEVEPLADDPVVDAVLDDVVDAATEIRRAVVESRPVIVRHAATVDGYVAGAAVERAVLPLVRDQHAAADAEYHYVDRRPLDDAFYDMEAATGDVTTMLDNAERHGEKLPLFVLVSAGSTRESLDGYALLDAYGAKRVVVDGGHADDAVADAVDAIVNPTLGGADDPSVPAALRADSEDRVTTGVLAANVAAHVNPDVRDDLAHLSAVTYWQDTPEGYAALAADAGYDPEFVSDLREAIALEAFYQSYEDKRELVQDLLWDAGNADLAAHVSGQFREKLDTELDTARPHVEEREVAGVRFRVLDTEAFTHRFDFPPIDLLLDALHRRDTGPTPAVIVGVDEDEICLRSTDPVNVRAVADAVADEIPDGGVRPKGSRDGRVEFLVGERERVLEATIREVAQRL
jgi:RecJ-like exonuclease